MPYLQAFILQGRAELLGQRGDGVKPGKPLRIKSVKKLASPIFGLPMLLCNAAKLLIIKAKKAVLKQFRHDQWQTTSNFTL